MIVYTECSADCDVPSVLTHDLFLISEDVKNVLLFYNKDLILKNAVLIDYERSRQFAYFLPIFEYVDCLVSPDEQAASGSKIIEPMLHRKAASGKSMFRTDRDVTQKAAIRLDVAESLMRRGITGFKLTRIAEERI
jgi:hypothetical protein